MKQGKKNAGSTIKTLSSLKRKYILFKQTAHHMGTILAT